MHLIKMLRTGKNSNLLYYSQSFLRYITPKILFRARLKSTLGRLYKRKDKEYILERVDYYNKMNRLQEPGYDAQRVSEFKLNGHSKVYFFDSYEFVRWFNGSLKFNYLFGDIRHIPEKPSITKSRPIMGDNANSVILKLEKSRHFTFLKDKTAFRDKMNKAIFRGHIIDKPHRIKFMEMYFGHPMCNAGIISPNPQFPSEWAKKKITLYDHLSYKFIIALEGNDVASNLKWVMSSNSIAVMPKPVYETWFMEGKLIPDYHYIEIKSDYSDLEERLNYFIEHPEKAEEISAHAHDYIAQFKNREREKLISLLVLEKYFRMTGQI